MSRQRSMETILQSEYVTIGELVRLTDVRYSTLKFYTEEGLLPFEQAEENLTRRYRREASLERIALLRRLREEGKSIPEIKELLFSGILFSNEETREAQSGSIPGSKCALPRSGMEVAMKDEDYNIPEDQDYTSAASAYDCTGLVPSGTGKPEELAAYKELYPFGQPELSEKEAKAMRAGKRPSSDS